MLQSHLLISVQYYAILHKTPPPPFTHESVVPMLRQTPGKPDTQPNMFHGHGRFSLLDNDRIIELAIAAVAQAHKDADAGCAAAADWLVQQQRDTLPASAR